MIQAAITERIDTVLLDDRKARKVARDIYSLRVTGSAGLLLQSKRHGLLPAISPCFDTLKARGYWIHESITAACLALAGE